ncbi:MAG: substrate-binding domain-containing protein, partial [Rhodoferax sp.]
MKDNFKRSWFWIGLFFILATGQVKAQQSQWNGPSRGPPAQPGKKVVYIASDFKNGGVIGVYRGLQEASRKLGWDLQLLNGAGDQALRAKMLNQAITAHPDGIIFGGFEPDDYPIQIAAAKQSNITLVGWHAAKASGPTKALFVNITTDPVDVANIAANFIIKDAMNRQKTVGVVIFNDQQFAIANSKTEAMRKVIDNCAGYKGCKVLAVENVPISEASTLIPVVV